MVEQLKKATMGLGFRVRGTLLGSLDFGKLPCVVDLRGLPATRY